MYLWRREVPNSGGAGRQRGGNGIEFALTPIDTDEVSGVMATHGTRLPNRTGIFGGFPGSSARFEIVRGSDVLADLQRGVVIDQLADADGQYEELAGVNSGLIVRPGEIVNIRLQNGGGYGDPILRDPERVAHDIVTGAVTSSVAQEIYGVLISGGAPDLDATSEMRGRIREERRSRMRRTTGPHAEADGVAAAGSWGESLRFRAAADVTMVHCGHCDAELGPAGGDWRELVGALELSASELGPLIQVHEDLIARMFVCPECVTALWVDVLPAAGESWRDFTLQ
jgi:N-methylhydantoinase B